MKAGAEIERRLLTVAEVAAYLGLSPWTIYTMVSQRRIPFVKIGGTKFDKKELDAWIEKKSVRPRTPAALKSAGEGYGTN